MITDLIKSAWILVVLATTGACTATSNTAESTYNSYVNDSSFNDFERIKICFDLGDEAQAVSNGLVPANSVNWFSNIKVYPGDDTVLTKISNDVANKFRGGGHTHPKLEEIKDCLIHGTF